MLNPVQKIIVLGGGSAGFMAAGAIKLYLRDVEVLVIRSKDIGVIGVGEGSTVALTDFLHQVIRVLQPDRYAHEARRQSGRGQLSFAQLTVGRGRGMRAEGFDAAEAGGVHSNAQAIKELLTSSASAFEIDRQHPAHQPIAQLARAQLVLGM